MFLVLYQVLRFRWTMWPIILLNMSSNTALPEDTTSLYTGITCCWMPLPTQNLKSKSISLLKRNGNLSSIVALVPCQLYVDNVGKLECPLCNWMLVRALVSGLAAFAELLDGLLQILMKFCYSFVRIWGTIISACEKEIAAPSREYSGKSIERASSRMEAHSFVIIRRERL